MFGYFLPWSFQVRTCLPCVQVGSYAPAFRNFEKNIPTLKAKKRRGRKKAKKDVKIVFSAGLNIDLELKVYIID